MRKPPAVLLAVVAALGAAYYAWATRAGRVGVDVLTPAPDEPARPPGSIAGSAPGEGELARAPDRPPPRPAPTAREPALTVARTGDVVVTLVPPAGVALPTSLVLDVEPVGFAVHAKRLALEQTDRTWRYVELAEGRWRVRAFVEGFVDASRDVEARAGVETMLSIPLERGAMATWKASLLSGETPPSVRVSLLDGRGVPRAATFETAATTVHAASEASPTLPPSGRILGLRPGTYRLRVTSPEGESDEKPFKVAIGETASLEFILRR